MSSDMDLEYIYLSLQADEEFGQYYTAPSGSKYWHTALWLIDRWEAGSGGRDLFGWSHYGSSANKATKKDLRWIIRTIFEMTPAQFRKTYICRA